MCLCIIAPSCRSIAELRFFISVRWLGPLSHSSPRKLENLQVSRFSATISVDTRSGRLFKEYIPDLISQRSVQHAKTSYFPDFWSLVPCCAFPFSSSGVPNLITWGISQQVTDLFPLVQKPFFYFFLCILWFGDVGSICACKTLDKKWYNTDGISPVFFTLTYDAP